MKKIYLSILTSAFAFTVNAQLTLTKINNEPSVGNVNTQKGYDSTSVLPKNTGLNQTWNFSSITANTVVTVTTYTTAASTPSASSFPGATLAEGDGTGAFTYWKSNANNFELMGMADAGSFISYTNTAIAVTWPVTYGYSGTDLFAGNALISSMSGPVNGTITTNATGTGSLVLPGSITFTNVLQVRMNNNLILPLGGTFTINIASTEYQYYHSTQKFPILTLSYEKQTITTIMGPTVTPSYQIKVNNAIALGVNEATFDKAFVVYPNPANGQFNVMFTNEKNENLSLEIMNISGQTVKVINLGNANDINTNINVTDLVSGVYFVKTTLGDKSVVKKLVIQ